MVIVLGLAAAALLGNLMSYWEAGNYLLLSFGTMILGLQAWVVFEGALAVHALRRNRPVVPDVRVH